MSYRKFSRIYGLWMVGLCCTAAPAIAASPGEGAFTAALEIDRAVARFTGAGIGDIGGARRPVDPRLRLAFCPHDLALDWHGEPGRTVRVVCPTARGWQIFVSLNPAVKPEVAPPAISRGDQITVEVRGNGFSVRQSGEARESGRRGDWIAIRLAHGEKPLSARVERPGLVVIETR